jgi:hypothetical protein
LLGKIAPKEEAIVVKEEVHRNPEERKTPKDDVLLGFSG